MHSRYVFDNIERYSLFEFIDGFLELVFDFVEFGESAVQGDFVLELLPGLMKGYSLVRESDFSLDFLLISLLSLFLRKLQCAALRYSSAFFNRPSMMCISAMVSKPGKRKTESSPPSLSFSSVINL